MFRFGFLDEDVEPPEPAEDDVDERPKACRVKVVRGSPDGDVVRVGDEEFFLGTVESTPVEKGVDEGGSVLWECALDLARYLEKHQSVVGLCALELGCGRGLLGLWCLRRGATDVAFCDYNDSVLRCATSNAVARELDCSERRMGNARLYAGDWRDVTPLLNQDYNNARFDVVLTAETTYREDLARALARTLADHLADDGLAFVATKRYYFGTGGGSRPFLDALPRHGLEAVKRAAPLVPATVGDSPHVCRWCGASFGSRNALFRHLRSSSPCLDRAVAADPAGAKVLAAQKQKRYAVLTVGYPGGAVDGETAERAVRECFFGGITTRATAASHRSRSAARSQESGCASSGDVISVSYEGPLVEDVETRLATRGVRVLAVSRPRRAFHAEARCAERTYHYCLPLEWLEGWVDDDASLFEEGHRPRGVAVTLSGAQRALRSLKAALREVERVFSSGGDATWQNFVSSPAGLSPHHRPLAARLDRCRVVRLIRDPVPCAVVAFRARHFVSEQVRRLIAAALAVQRGLLDADYIRLAARQDIVVPPDVLAPFIAPPLLYFAGARFKLRSRSTPFSVGGGPGAVDRTETFAHDLRRKLLLRLENDTFVSDMLPRVSARVKAHLDCTTEATPRARGAPPDARRYGAVLELLREAWASGNAPRTSVARARLIRGAGAERDSGSFTLANPDRERPGGNSPLANARFPALARAVFALEKELRNASSATCAVNSRAAFQPHVDSGTGAGQSLSLVVGLGDYEGGELVIEGTPFDIRYKPLAFDGWRQRHWTLPFEGERFSLVFFTATQRQKKSSRSQLAADVAARLSLEYRADSTDVEAVVEVLGPKPCYRPPDELAGGFDWGPRDHVVLDCGAHIGCFSRYALDRGARSVKAFEPEPSNAALARHNSKAEIVQAAVVARAETTTTATLVLGRTRARDGARNTWRHALERYNHYAEPANLEALPRQTVRCVGFFDVLDDDVTFVKLDVEGAELEILDGFLPGAWRNVCRLVFEYSFTKRPQLAPFRAIVANLEREGFQVAYDFRDTLDTLDEWPGRTDALVFCARACS
ncbi:hypothetical protein CTAYLR_001861 [Chrysophaeum taylorii]|uniref:Methyltransferase FkbM domain-containing protein n=1 Tax=Chrysophaeum taylorii TaxID=2483200 RepID=A0AAD7U835_9STRA|nr:hypothetical protein CTAYLR_001861 [Chrysophaeum taylorii]